MIRTFIALELSTEARRALGELQKEFRKTGVAASWADPERMHLTLKFLGDVAPERIPSIGSSLTEAAGSFSPLRLQPMGCGAFPTIKEIRVVWAGLRGDLDRLRQLHQRIDSSLVTIGFEPEKRPFMPHLTLGRIKEVRNLQPLREALLSHAAFQAEAFDAPDVVLYKSELSREGAQHTPLLRAVFSKAES